MTFKNISFKELGQSSKFFFYLAAACFVGGLILSFYETPFISFLIGSQQMQLSGSFSLLFFVVAFILLVRAFRLQSAKKDGRQATDRLQN